MISCALTQKTVYITCSLICVSLLGVVQFLVLRSLWFLLVFKESVLHCKGIRNDWCLSVAERDFNPCELSSV